MKFKLLYEIDPSVSKIVHNLIQSESAVRKELIGKQSIQKKIAGALIVTIAAGGLAYVFAPMIAPVIVGVISEGTVAGLYGVALTNASLAYLGFGSLAAGGYGMAGGTVLLSSGGALLAFLSSASTVAVSEWQNKDLNKYVLESVEKIALMSDRVLSKEYRDKETIKGIIKQLKSAKKTIDQLKRNPCVLIDEWDKLTEREKKKREKIVKDNLQYTGTLLSKCESMLKYDCEMIDIYIETETAIADLKKRYDIME